MQHDTRYCDQGCGYRLPTEYGPDDTICGACLDADEQNDRHDAATIVARASSAALAVLAVLAVLAATVPAPVDRLDPDRSSSCRLATACYADRVALDARLDALHAERPGTIREAGR